MNTELAVKQSYEYRVGCEGRVMNTELAVKAEL